MGIFQCHVSDFRGVYIVRSLFFKTLSPLQGSSNATFSGGIKLDAHIFGSILREFPKIKVHEVWVGNIMTPAIIMVQ